MADRYADLNVEMRQGLKPWADVLGDDMIVVFYDHDGLDTPDIWADGPHLAIQIADFLMVQNNGRPLAWPVDYEGWDNPRQIGWQGVLERLQAQAQG